MSKRLKQLSSYVYISLQNAFGIFNLPRKNIYMVFAYILQYNNLNLGLRLNFGSWFLILCAINNSHSFVMYGPLNFPDCSNFSKVWGLFQMCQECKPAKQRLTENDC